MKTGSLKRKLTIRNSIILALVFFSFLTFYFFQQRGIISKRIAQIREEGRENLVEKGRLMILDKNVSFKQLVPENSWTLISKILSENLSADKDMVLAGLVREGTFDLRAWATLKNRNGDIFETGSRELVPDLVGKVMMESGLAIMKNDTTTWALSLEKPDHREVEEGDRIFYEFAAPIFAEVLEIDEDDTEITTDQKIAAVFYRLSTENMERLIEREKAQYRADQQFGLILTIFIGMGTLFLGFFFTRRQADTITQPLAHLTEAAERISKGNYDVQVTISSGDEIETLGITFNQMTRDLARSYTDINTRNRQLEEARNELEHLNRNLENKVRERTQQLAESESKFRTLFEESADAILLGSEDNFLDCNPAMLEMMGCHTKAQLLHMTIDDISPETQPDDQSSSEKLHEFFRLARNQGSRQFEWVNRKVDGAEFHTEIVITSFPLSGKQVLHMVFRDITERKRTEAALKDAQAQLVETAHSAGMAEIATGVLHNIGNILNSVNISTEEISHTLKISKIKGFLKANDLLVKNMDNLGYFLSEHPKGKLVPGYYISLGEAIKEEHQIMTDEIRALGERISMMRDVISTQQSYAKATLYTEDIVVADLIEDALKLQLASLKKQGVKIRKDFRTHPRGMVSKVKLVHVLTNLIKNGKEAMGANEKLNKPQEMVIRIEEPEKGSVEIQVEDNGCGIKAAHLEKIFNHGFTTKANGHGFGLHTCANFMTEMGGSLYAESDGEGMGSRFILRFPLMRAEEITIQRQ